MQGVGAPFDFADLVFDEVEKRTKDLKENKRTESGEGLRVTFIEKLLHFRFDLAIGFRN